MRAAGAGAAWQFVVATILAGDIDDLTVHVQAVVFPGHGDAGILVAGEPQCEGKRSGLIGGYPHGQHIRRRGNQHLAGMRDAAHLIDRAGHRLVEA